MRSYGAMFSGAGPRSCPACWILAALILAIQAAVEFAGGPREVAPGYETFGLSRDGFLAGKFWQILTYGFLHGGWVHAVVNAFFVLMIGSRVERSLGCGRTTLAALLGLVAGGLAHLAVGGENDALLVGFSGACVALLLVVTTLSPESRMWPIPVSGRSLGLGILTAEFLLALANPAAGIPGFTRIGIVLSRNGMESWFQIGHACHFGGGMAGALYGRWLLRPRITLERLRRDRQRREKGTPM